MENKMRFYTAELFVLQEIFLSLKIRGLLKQERVRYMQFDKNKIMVFCYQIVLTYCEKKMF